MIYDPLDRNIPEDDENQAIKRVDLLNLIDNLGFIKTDELDIPLSNEMSLMLNRMFLKGHNACNDILKAYVNEAEEMGMAFQKIFADEPLVQ